VSWVRVKRKCEKRKKSGVDRRKKVGNCVEKEQVVGVERGEK